MVFTSPSWVPQLPRGRNTYRQLLCLLSLMVMQLTQATDPPDSISLDQFIFSDQYGRKSKARSKHPYQCDRTGRSYTISELEQRVDHLARALSKRLNITPNEGTEWDKVIAVFSVNTVCSCALHPASWLTYCGQVLTPPDRLHTSPLCCASTIWRRDTGEHDPFGC